MLAGYAAGLIGLPATVAAYAVVVILTALAVPILGLLRRTAARRGSAAH